MAYKYNNGYGAIICDKCRVIICTGNEAATMAKENATEDLCDACSLLMDNDDKCTALKAEIAELKNRNQELIKLIDDYNQDMDRLIDEVCDLRTACVDAEMLRRRK